MFFRDQVRDFIYIDDVVDVIFKVFKNTKAKGQIFNIGSGKKTKLKIIEYIREYLNSGKPQYGLVKLKKMNHLICIHQLPKLRNLS